MAPPPRLKRRASPARVPTAKARDAITKAALERAFVQCIAIVVHSFLRLGLKPSALAACLKAGVERARTAPYHPQEATLHRQLHHIGEMMGAWYIEPNLVDETGSPRRLPLEGAESFATLCARFLPGADPAALADELVEDGIVRRLPGGFLRPVRAGVDLATSGLRSLDVLPVRVHTVFENALYNHRDRGRRPRRLDREVGVFALPLRHLEEFDEIAKRTGHLLTMQVDQWLASKMRTARPEEPTARVSVCVLAAAEPNAKRAKTPSRRTRPRAP